MQYDYARTDEDSRKRGHPKRNRVDHILDWSNLPLREILNKTADSENGASCVRQYHVLLRQYRCGTK